MNFIQSPPNHYPSDQESTIEVFRTRNFSLGGPPPYGAERGPPQYHEATDAERGDQKTSKGRAKARKVRYIRILSSILVATTVALVVGAVVGKINMTKTQDKSSDDNEEVFVYLGVRPTLVFEDMLIRDGSHSKAPTPTNFSVAADETTGSENGNTFTVTAEAPKAQSEVHVRMNNALDRPISDSLSPDYLDGKLAEKPMVDDWDWDAG